MSNDPYVPMTAGMVMPDVVDELPEIPMPVRMTARVFADVVGETDWCGGRSPKGIATACVYIAEVIYDRDGRLTQMDLDEHSPVSYMTVRKNYQKMVPLLVELLDEDEEQLARLERPQELAIEQGLLDEGETIFEELKEINRLV